MRSRRIGIGLPFYLVIMVCTHLASDREACGGAIVVGGSAQVVNTYGKGLQVRSDPGVNGRVVANMPEGTRLTITGGPIQRDGYTWWKIAGSSISGWAAANWLAPLAATSPRPPTKPDPQLVTQVQQVRVAWQQLNDQASRIVYSTPSDRSAVTQELQRVGQALQAADTALQKADREATLNHLAEAQQVLSRISQRLKVMAEQRAASPIPPSVSPAKPQQSPAQGGPDSTAQPDPALLAQVQQMRDAWVRTNEQANRQSFVNPTDRAAILEELRRVGLLLQHAEGLAKRNDRVGVQTQLTQSRQALGGIAQRLSALSQSRPPGPQSPSTNAGQSTSAPSGTSSSQTVPSVPSAPGTIQPDPQIIAQIQQLRGTWQQLNDLAGRTVYPSAADHAAISQDLQRGDRLLRSAAQSAQHGDRAGAQGISSQASQVLSSLNDRLARYVQAAKPPQSNRPPEARIDVVFGGRRTQEGQRMEVQVPRSTTASVVLSAARSQDPEGQALQYAWESNSQPLGSEKEITRSFGAGSHDVSLTVRDPRGGVGQARIAIVVREAGASSMETPAQCRSSCSVAHILPNGLQWPLDGRRAGAEQVVQQFGANWPVDHYCGGERKKHVGIDIQAKPGDPVVAAAEGTVVSIFDSAGSGDMSWGRAIVISHNGFSTVYHHVQPIQSVTVGMRVKQGGVIATVYSMKGPHLHFGVRVGSNSAATMRGALPRCNTAESAHHCNDDPVFPECFVDPLQITYQDVSIVGQRSQSSPPASPATPFPSSATSVPETASQAANPCLGGQVQPYTLTLGARRYQVLAYNLSGQGSRRVIRVENGQGVSDSSLASVLSEAAWVYENIVSNPYASGGINRVTGMLGTAKEMRRYEIVQDALARIWVQVIAGMVPGGQTVLAPLNAARLTGRIVMNQLGKPQTLLWLEAMAGLQSAEEVYKQLATETTRAKAAGTQFRAELAPRLRLLYQVANTLEITYGPLLSAMMPQTAGALWAKLGNSLVSEALSLIGADLDALIDFQKVWKLKQIMEAQLATEPGFSAYFNGRRLAMAQASGTATQIATWTKSTVAGCSTGG